MQLLLVLVAAFLPFSLTLAQVSLDRKAEVVLEKVNILICVCKSHSQIVQKIWKLNLVLLEKSHFLRIYAVPCFVVEVRKIGGEHVSFAIIFGAGEEIFVTQVIILSSVATIR